MLSLRRVHHVGVVMPLIERATTLMELLGLAESYRGYVERYEAPCIFTEGNGSSRSSSSCRTAVSWRNSIAASADYIT